MNNKKILISLDSLTPTQNFDNYTFLKFKDDKLLSFSINKVSYSRNIYLKTNNTNFIRNILNFAVKINEELSMEYRNLAIQEIKAIKNTKSFWLQSENKNIDASNAGFKLLLNLKRYIRIIDYGELVYKIKYPTIPKKLSPKIKILYLISIILGHENNIYKIKLN